LFWKDRHMKLEINLTINWVGCKVNARQIVIIATKYYFNPLIVFTFNILINRLINDIVAYHEYLKFIS
jgi:hypothetical protein